LLSQLSLSPTGGFTSPLRKSSVLAVPVIRAHDSLVAVRIFWFIVLKDSLVLVPKWLKPSWVLPHIAFDRSLACCINVGAFGSLGCIQVGFGNPNSPVFALVGSTTLLWVFSLLHGNRSPELVAWPPDSLDIQPDFFDASAELPGIPLPENGAWALAEFISAQKFK